MQVQVRECEGHVKAHLPNDCPGFEPSWPGKHSEEVSRGGRETSQQNMYLEKKKKVEAGSWFLVDPPPQWVGALWREKMSI